MRKKALSACCPCEYDITRVNIGLKVRILVCRVRGGGVFLQLHTPFSLVGFGQIAIFSH